MGELLRFLQVIEAMALLEQVHRTVMQQEMVPFVQYVLLYRLKTLFCDQQHECIAYVAVK